MCYADGAGDHVRVKSLVAGRSSWLLLSAMHYDSAHHRADVGTFFRSLGRVNVLAH
jgi:hypothetical protein